MALTITVSGTPEEIAAFGKVLTRGLRPSKKETEALAETEAQAITRAENTLVKIIVNSGVIAAIKLVREQSGLVGPTGTLKGAKDYIDALISRAVRDGRLELDNTSSINAYKAGPNLK